MGRRAGSGVVVGLSVFMLVSWSLGLGVEMALAGAAVAKYKMEHSSAIHSFNE